MFCFVAFHRDFTADVGIRGICCDENAAAPVVRFVFGDRCALDGQGIVGIDTASILSRMVLFECAVFNRHLARAARARGARELVIENAATFAQRVVIDKAAIRERRRAVVLDAAAGT